MYRVLLLSLVVLSACNTPARLISYTVSTKPVYKTDPEPKKILLLNSYNVAAKKYRDKLEEVYITIINDLVDWAGNNIREKNIIQTQVIPGYTDLSLNKDSTVYALLIKHQATHAIVINSFDISFEQTRVDVTRSGDGSKDREAFYDIHSDINYSFYSTQALVKELTIHRSRYHSSRNVISGLLAAGPSVVAKKDDAFEISIENMRHYLNNFFPGEVGRTRQYFSDKEFRFMNAAITNQDYEAAMIENLKLINNPKKEIAAKAYYNCAVLYERKNQPEEARPHLEKSLAIYELTPARLMMKDYQE